ncbi:MAG: sulfur carrier protein ThiS [Pseudomonadota bacterium]|jgi:sulfur carrier protein|nr:sulfur carrier protein ThiS [Pseudomonadota bacterium]|tara:strand:- start:34 stop:234 length:201 start_codon:yes stop_codon:yes gene_type:complete
MNIFINGKVSEVKKNINIQDILRMNNISDENIVVEINRTIISKMYWDDTKIEENDKIEIITAVGGG